MAKQCAFCFSPRFLGLHPRHMEVPSLRVKSELQLPAYATATALWDPSHIFDLYHSSQQCWILNQLSEARDWTHILRDFSQACYCWAAKGTSQCAVFSVQRWRYSMKSESTKYWCMYRSVGIAIPCWWEYRFDKVFWKIKHWLRKLPVSILHDSAILFLGITPREIPLHVNQELALGGSLPTWFIIPRYWNNINVHW